PLALAIRTAFATPREYVAPTGDRKATRRSPATMPCEPCAPAWTPRRCSVAAPRFVVSACDAGACPLLLHPFDAGSPFVLPCARAASSRASPVPGHRRARAAEHAVDHLRALRAGQHADPDRDDRRRRPRRERRDPLPPRYDRRAEIRLR